MKKDEVFYASPEPTVYADWHGTCGPASRQPAL